MTDLQHLLFEHSEGDDGVITLESMASTRPDGHAAVMAEVQQVLDWAWAHSPGQHGPVEDGMVWDHDLLLQSEQGDWLTVTLTLSGVPHFIEAFCCQFGGSRT